MVAGSGPRSRATALSFGTVCAPGDRYHPAVVAQAAATLAEMYPGRFWLAVGSGEALNEHVTGAAWPEKPERNARLKECVDVMRGPVGRRDRDPRRAASACARRSSTRGPATPPLLLGGGATEETARWVGGWADGLITVAGEPDAMRRVIDAFRDGGGEGKPLFLQVALSYAATEDEARRRRAPRVAAGRAGPRRSSPTCAPRTSSRRGRAA